MSPLTALNKAYETRLKWTLELPHLGIAGCTRHGVDVTTLGIEPDLPEMDARTKDPVVVSVEYIADGRPKLMPLKSRCSWPVGKNLTHDLVRRGVHPLDIIVATWDWQTDSFTFRPSVEHMFWTHKDQIALEREEARVARADGDGAEA